MVRKIAGWTGVGLFILLIAFFLFRNAALHYVFTKVQKRLSSNYGLELLVEEAHFSNIDHVCFKHLTIQPQRADTLIAIEHVTINISFLHLLTGTVAFDAITADSLFISIYNSAHRNNVKFKAADTSKQPKRELMGTTDFYQLAKGFQRNLLLLFNTKFDVRETRVNYTDSLLHDSLYIPAVSYDLKHLTGKLVDTKTGDSLLFTGKAIERNKRYSLQLTHYSKENKPLPLSGSELGLSYGFSSLTGLLEFESTGDKLSASTSIGVKDFLVRHWRLSTEDVVLPDASLKAIFNFTKNAVEIDSASYCTIKNTKANLFANYTSKPKEAFTCSLRMADPEADTFFHSLPDGMFSTLKGISCTGKLNYHLFFSIPLQQPDSLVFESALKKKNFGIRHFGAENFARINEPFIYEAYDKDRFVRYIEVSPANSMFTPLNRISPYLVNSVLQSEDPSFMQHRGFLLESFRESIVKNYKEKRFARGGSTISMQLVKNVFLSRNKTVSRKVEEALIVYLIENLGLVSKERMLEIYLNVIEWGPNVYGIGEASRFYFNKNPMQLTLQESIYLAGIIPAPKHFKYQFDKQGQLKKYLSSYFKILSGRMVYKGRISPQDTVGLTTNVKLTGPALRMVVPSDSVLLPENFTEEF